MSHSQSKRDTLSLQKLASKIRSMFPGVIVQSPSPSQLSIKFPVNGAPEVDVSAKNVPDSMYSIETSLVLRPRTLKNVRESDFLRLIADENTGLRGVTVLCHGSIATRALKLKNAFISAANRETDEIENVGIDILSLLRFAQILEERISQSSVAGVFCYQTYHKRTVRQRRGHRHINFARHVFQGNIEHIFAQITSTLRGRHGYSLLESPGLSARITSGPSAREMLMRVPEDAPIVTCSMPLEIVSTTPSGEGKLLRSLSELNLQSAHGHYEVDADYKQISFSIWKHLTNALHHDSVGHLVTAMHEAETALKSEQSFTKAQRKRSA